MSDSWTRPIKLLLLAILVTAGVLASASFGTRPANAQVGPCPVGFVFTSGGCVPASAIGGCPVGFVFTNGGCVPVSAIGGCPVGFVLTNGGCVPASAIGGCSVGFVLTSAGCMPSQTVNTCAAGFVLTASGCVATAGSVSVAGTTNLLAGCDEVVLTSGFGANTPVTTIVVMVQPSGIVTSVWQFSNSLHTFLAVFFSTPGAPTDANTVGASQSVFMCVSDSGIFAPQAPQGASATSCADGFVLTASGCLPTASIGGCPAGFGATVSGCQPLSGSCAAGFAFVPGFGGCVPISGTGACPAGFVAIATLGGCVPLSTVGGCPVGFFFNTVTGTCSFSE